MPQEEVPDYKIVTITASKQFEDFQVSLLDVMLFLELDSQIIGVKYALGKSLLRGLYETSLSRRCREKMKVNKTGFYNQISFVLALEAHKRVNVKLFQNGSIHITGLRTVAEADTVAEVILRKIKDLGDRSEEFVVHADASGIPLLRSPRVTGTTFIMNTTLEQVIGFVSHTDTCEYIIEKHRYRKHPSLPFFVSVTNCRVRDLDGLLCGSHVTRNLVKVRASHSVLITSSPQQRRVQLGMEYVETTRNAYDTSISRHTYKINSAYLPTGASLDTTRTLKYSCPVYEPRGDAFVNVHCINASCAWPTSINLQKLTAVFGDMGVSSLYRPESYAALRVRNEPHMTFLVFQSGAIITTGSRSYSQVQLSVRWIFDLLRRALDASSSSHGGGASFGPSDPDAVRSDGNSLAYH